MCFQESIKGRISDAGLGASLDRMKITEAKNIGIISKENELDKTNIKLAKVEDQDTLTEHDGNSIDGVRLSKMDYCDEYCDSLEVLCQQRISGTHQALKQVTLVLLKRSYRK